MQIRDSSTDSDSLCILHRPIATEPAKTELNCLAVLPLLICSSTFRVSPIISLILLSTSFETSENSSYWPSNGLLDFFSSSFFLVGNTIWLRDGAIKKRSEQTKKKFSQKICLLIVQARNDHRQLISVVQHQVRVTESDYRTNPVLVGLLGVMRLRGY